MADSEVTSKNPVGRPPKFKDAYELQTKFEDWRLTFNIGGERFGEFPEVEGFCDYIDSYRDLFSEYEKKPEFSDTVKRIKNWIYYRKKQLTGAGKYPVALFIFDAKNNAGYVEKMEQDITSGGEKFSPVLVRFIDDSGTDAGNTDTEGV